MTNQEISEIYKYLNPANFNLEHLRDKMELPLEIKWRIVHALEAIAPIYEVLHDKGMKAYREEFGDYTCDE